ncbi:hypothetical protein ARMGADRAFT_1088191 [Armillaria gallica]|uniref:Uncharacterized protein n=1 Tax=Armillaria gallica TaxID=47427 RepID=A0A2H3CNT4_ARMGA|nr:hypothetical protein ARMGADRAFT_1088191 [Armillaria gallica]
MSSVGRHTASLATHSSHPLIAPSQARSQQVLSPSQHSAYRSYLEASDEEILEELARRRRRREGEAPGEFPQHSSAPVRSRSDLGARGPLSPSMTQPAATPSHAGSRVYASPYRVANISPSCATPGLSPALSTSPEARTSSSPPAAHRAAAPSHHGSWASAPLPREGIYSPPLSPPLSAPARMPPALQAAPSPVEGVVHLSPPPLASPPHVRPTSRDHREVVSPSRSSRLVSQDIPPDTSYVPSPKTPRSTFVTADVPWDYSSSVLNRMNSSLSIQAQCDSDAKSENSSHDLSNFDNDLKAAIATLSLPQQPGESDVAFSRRRDAYACLTMRGPLVQEVVPSPPMKCEDISLRSARLYRGKVTDIPLNDSSTDSSPVKQPQSASIKHELKSSVYEPKRISPRGSMEAKFQSIRTSAPIQFEEGTPLKKSESPALPRGESSHQQASAAQDTKNHRLESSSQDKMKAKSPISRTPMSLDSDNCHSASQKDTLGRPHRSLSSVPFQHVRRRSEHPIFNDKEIFDYHPVSRSETDVMLAIFQRFERLVARNLLTPRLGLDSNVQKTSLQSIPRPHKFHGDPDIIEFDNWLFSVIRWMKIANICGPIYHTDSSGTQQVSDIDVQRTNTLATFLDGDARTWYNNSVEDCNGNVEDDFPTFMQVINGLFRRFIHESSLYDVVQHFKSVTYASAGGVRQLFADLTRFANIMPSPPDVYSFRHQLLISLPTRIRREITREGITAEASTVDQIMQQALIIERGSKAEQYYSPQHSRYNQALEDRHGTAETRSEYSSGTQDSASDYESDCSTGTSSSTDPIKSDNGETTKDDADTRGSMNPEDSEDSTSTSRVTSSQITR